MRHASQTASAPPPATSNAGLEPSRWRAACKLRTISARADRIVPLASASFVSSFAALPATCDGATATTTADLDANGTFATTCQATGLVEALGRTCAFAPDFSLVDPTCLD